MIISSGSVEMAARRSYAKVNANAYGMTLSPGGADRYGGRGSFMEYLQMKDGGMRGRMPAQLKAGRMDEAGAMESLRRQSLMYILNAIHRLFRKRDGMQLKADTIGFAGGMVSISEKSCSMEYEETVFDTTGSVVTKDGRTMDFKLNVSMTRRFEQYFERRTDIGELIDPLVINLDSAPPGLSEQKIVFDLDADGTAENISVPTGGGFLALDKNADGDINDGSELFGTRSGDGFADLAEYDSDGNGWIDEADPVFDRLKIWVVDADGSRQLYSLKDKNIGAICLASADTEFSLTSLQDNNLNGKIRKSGVFLYEDGRAGSMMHIDIMKRA
ncbi:MAG: hypothetical protein K5686_03285 [Lachnospiraceae bacterium]|nr:hypothetical protein [Lachnospiraceae bacterium]